MSILPGFTGPVEELAGSPEINFTREGGDATAQFKINWSDIQSFLQLAMPDPVVVGGAIYTPPAGLFPSIPWLYVKKVKITPLWDDTIVGDGTFPANYSHAKATVTYNAEEWDQNEKNTGGKPVQTNDTPGNPTDPNNTPIPYVSHKLTIGGEFLTWPNAGLQWETPSDPNYDMVRFPDGPPPNLIQVSDQVHAGVAMPTVEHTLEWKHVAFPPWANIKAMVGKVNAFTFTSAPPETLLFLGAEASREITSDGTRGWTLSYKFSEKNMNAINPLLPFGWNHFLRPDGLQAGNFDRLRKRPGGGFTTLAAKANAGDAQISVQSLNGFPTSRANPLPANAQFNISIAGGVFGSEQYTVSAVIPSSGAGSPNTFVLTSNLISGRAAGVTITQIYTGTLVNAISSLQTQFLVTNNGSFPVNGGVFYIQINNEIMEVWQVIVSGNNLLFSVIRGIEATVPAPHAQNATVTRIPGFVYDKTDFRYLFVPGLLIG